MTVLPADESALFLRCQSCDFPLTFVEAILGGVNPVERWDRYVCRRCATAFEYRSRTRKLKRTA
jgi:hypothetical protein